MQILYLQFLDNVASEWLLFNANIFSVISWREQLNFQWDDDKVRFAVDQHA
jgi:hypothetical protein